MEHILIILVCLIFSAFFSGMEIAFVSSNKLKLELKKKENSITAILLRLLTKNPSHFIAAMLVGNNIALVVYGISTAAILEPFIKIYFQNEIIILSLQTIISTLIILVTAEFIPKAVFRRMPNDFLSYFSVPVFFIFILLYPIVVVISIITNFILKLFLRAQATKQSKELAFGKIDLGNLLDETTKNDSIQSNVLVDPDVKIFQNALGFSETRLRECFIPRNETVAIDVNSTIDELKQKFIESGFSKILVYENSIDNIIGYAHSYDLFNKPSQIKDILRSVLFAPETMTAQKMLTNFIRQNKSIAVVVDEVGGTSGILTIEDLIEEIFGEIEDEHDTSEYTEKQISEDAFVLSGRLEIDRINEKFNLNLPISEEYETIAGFILYYNENLPVKGEEIVIKLDSTYHIKVLKISHMKIDLLELRIS